ncbi:MAG: tyrosine--tRNA ligase [Candidatus Sumerlaeaceae bacterium]
MTTPEIPAEIRDEYELLTSSVVDVLPRSEFIAKLQRSRTTGKPLRIKYGADPSAPDIHLGHSVPIRKLKQFQDAGHQVVFIIGGYTARIGDPSGKNTARPRLSKEDVQRNARTYLEQIFKILDREKTEVVDNSDWLEGMDVSATIDLMSRYTVSQMLEREDFHNRFNSETPIYIHEFIYPLLQGYDSIAVRADVELGGTDQKFNLLVGRELQRQDGQEPQCIMTMPLLVGLDGQHKMSKSLGNYIGVNDSPRDIFGKAMSIPDELMPTYLELAAGAAAPEVARFQADLSSGRLHPRDAKMMIASRLTDCYHGPGTGAREQEDFRLRFSAREFPDDTAEQHSFQLSDVPNLQQLLLKLGAVKSGREAQRLIEQKAVKCIECPEVAGLSLDTENNTDVLRRPLVPGHYKLKIGKTRFAVVTLNGSTN